ncbi:MAG: patatin-like phospholipase family protein [Lutibacter sp.]
MRALVISGGGSKGAFAGGIAEYLICQKHKEYDLYVGTSVGSLLISLLALKKIKHLKKVFTNLTNQSIFNRYPFSVKKLKKGISLKINHFNTVQSFLKGCSTFGESKNLRKLIATVFSENDFNQLKNQKQVIVTVSNLTLQKIEYQSIENNNYEDFCDWMWASANFVPFMSLIEKNNYQYADGGFGSYIPVLKAIELGAKQIYVIVLDNVNLDRNLTLASNPFQTLVKTFKFMSNQIGLNDVLIGKLKGMQTKIDINLYNCPENLTEYPLYFNPVQLKSWWEIGYQFAEHTNPLCYCYLPNGEMKKMKENE